MLVSPVAIFFAVIGNPGAPGQNEPSIAVVMVDLERDLLGKVDAEKAVGDFDSVEVIYEGSEDNVPIINVQDVIAVFSVLDNMSDLEDNPEAVARLTSEQVELLRNTFWEMNQITVSWWREEIPYDGPPLYDEHVNRLPDPPPTIKRIKIITINSLGFEEVIDDYGFNADEQDMRMLTM